MLQNLQVFTNPERSFTLCDYNWEDADPGRKSSASRPPEVCFLRHESVYLWEFGGNTGAEIVAAYLKYGEELAQGITLGSSSFILCDSARDLILAARDFMGKYPLYYHHSSQRKFTFSFSMNALLASKQLEPAINYAKVAEYIACRPGLPPNNQTFYQNTYRLMPAHLLYIEQRQIRQLRRYGRFDRAKFRGWTDTQYIDRFRELFVQSVETQTVAPQKVAASLSGGLDSSAVCGVAQSLRRESIQTFNFDTRTDEASEELYVKAVVDKWKLDHRTLHQSHSNYEAIRQLTLANGQPIFTINHSNQLDNIEAARRQGCDVFLSGHWGDQVVGHGFGYLTELAAAKDWAGLKKAIELDDENSIFMQPPPGEETPAGRLRTKKQFAFWLVAGKKVDRDWWLRLPGVVWILVRHFDFKPADFLVFARQRWQKKPPAFSGDALILPDVRAAAEAHRQEFPAEVTKVSNLVAGPLSPSERAYLANIFVNNETYGQEEFFEIYRQYGLHAVQPFIDAALIELNLSVPMRLKFDNGRKRGTLRRAMADYLPPEVTNRVTKGVFSKYHQEEFRKLHEEFLAKTSDEHEIWQIVDRKAFAAQARFSLDDGNDLQARSTTRRSLTRVIQLAIWLDCREESEKSKN